MEVLKLHKDDPGMRPGDLITVSYGGAGITYASVCIDIHRSTETGNLVLNHFVFSWRRRELPKDLTVQWLRRYGDRIYGEHVPNRVCYASDKMLTSEDKTKYNAIKQVLEHEYKNYWATDPV